jgi:hypothetical protein
MHAYPGRGIGSDIRTQKGGGGVATARPQNRVRGGPGFSGTPEEGKGGRTGALVEALRMSDEERRERWGVIGAGSRGWSAEARGT